MIEIEVPGYLKYRLQDLVLDVNGTIAEDGQLLEGVVERFEELRQKIQIHLITADTHKNQAAIDRSLRLAAVRIPEHNQANAKLDYIKQLGVATAAAIGNGANDAAMLEHAALGILVIGPEGAATEALLKAKVVVPNIQTGLGLLLHPKRLIATLRR
jgi:P-type E1-E2 ATPase